MKAAAEMPDAWDDDWEAQADSVSQQEAQPDPAPAPLTKAERLEQHAEANRKLWKSAYARAPPRQCFEARPESSAESPADRCLFSLTASDTPQTFHYLEANNDIPLASTFKPQVKVLSRNPVVVRDPVTGLAQLALDDTDQSDKRETQLTPDQIRAKQKRDREEKQWRYDEARAKIFGESASSSHGSSPGTITPPRSEGRQHPAPGRGRGRGGGPRSGPDPRQAQPDIRRQNGQGGPTRELYDPNYAPNYAPKSDPISQRRVPEGDAWKSPSARDEPQQPIRAPRGPDGSGRRGAGFVRRGAKGS